MKNKLFYLLLISYNSLTAQVNIEEGPVIKSPDGNEIVVIGEDELAFNCLKNDGDFYFEKISKSDLSLVKSIPLEGITYKNYLAIYEVDGNYLLLTVTNDRKEDIVGVSYQLMTKDGGLSVVTQLVNIPKSRNKGYFSERVQNYFSTAISPDKSKLLVLVFDHHDQIIDKIAYVYDTRSMNLLNKRNVTEPNPEKIEAVRGQTIFDYDVIGSNGFSIDNAENIISIGNIQVKKSQESLKRDDDFLYNTGIYSTEPKYIFVHGKDEITTIDINPTNEFLLNPENVSSKEFLINSALVKRNIDYKLSGIKKDFFNDTLIVCGFYSKQISKDSLEFGVFSLILDLLSKKHVIKYDIFPEELKNKIQYSFGTVNCANSLYKIGNEYFLLGEQRAIDVNGSLRKAWISNGSIGRAPVFNNPASNPMGAISKTDNRAIFTSDQNYLSTLICKIRANGSLEWICALPKNLLMREQGDMHIPHSGSFFSKVHNNSIYILQYSDFEVKKDYNINDIFKISRYENAQVGMFKISKDGTFQYSPFTAKFNLQPNFPSSRNFNNYIFYVMGNKGVVYFNSKGNEHYGRFNLN